MAPDELQEPYPADKNTQNLDLPDLWKYFQDRADMLKERQWTIGTWILTLLSGVAAFSLSQETLSITRTGIAVGKPLPAFVLGLVGILICGYGVIVIRNYGTHIQRNWDRANRAKKKIAGLDAIWNGETRGDQQGRHSLPRESIYLLVIVAGFVILLTGIGFVALVATIYD